MMRPSRSITAAAACLLLAACAPAVQRSPAEQILVYRGRDVEAVLADGRRVHLANPQVTADSVYGAWTASEPPARVAVALADIRSIRVVSPSAMQRQVARDARREATFSLLMLTGLLAVLVFGVPAL